MSDYHAPDSTSSSSQPPFRASVTFTRSLREPFNILMVFGPFGLISFITCVMVIGGFNIIFPIFLSIFSVFIFFQLWAMVSTSIVLTAEGIEYHVTYQHLTIPWDTIESVKLEPRKKQITFRSNSKIRRIHEFGFPPESYLPLKDAMLEELKKRHVVFLQ